MKVAFLSHRLTPHQIPFCREMCKICDDFVFIQLIKYDSYWESKGGRMYAEDYPYLLFYDNEKAPDILNDFDVVITSASHLDKLQDRIKANKMVFVYSERLYKKPFTVINFLHRMVSAYIHHGRFQKFPIYMLCASAYTASDVALFGNYKNKCYKWGYFPEVKVYKDINSLIGSKQTSTLLWVARLIDWKHPEIAVLVAKKLREAGCEFKLNIIGGGDMNATVKKMIADYRLDDCVNMLGEMNAEDVREYMEKSQIFLFTSDRNEGWGAVLNEAMNSGCAVVANDEIGAVPFLMKDKVNGLVYSGNNVDEICKRVKYLLDNPNEAKKLGENAYFTVKNEWSAENAAERFLQLYNEIKNIGKCDLFAEGPCSKG